MNQEHLECTQGECETGTKIVKKISFEFLISVSTMKSMQTGSDLLTTLCVPTT